MIPIAFVLDIHFRGDSVKAFKPASFLNPSNSRGLKSGLYNVSQMPKYSIVFLIAHPVSNYCTGIIRFILGYIGQRNIIGIVDFYDR